MRPDAMPYSSLCDIMEEEEKTGQLVCVREAVSPYLEMKEIGRRLIDNNGPAVLFENVREGDRHYSMPALINLFGTVERVALGMGRKPHELREVGQTLAFLKQPE